MPLGIVIILILVVLLIFNYKDNICYTLALSRKSAVIFFLAITLFYTISPVTIEGVTTYWLPFLSILFYSLYLLTKLEFIWRNIVLSVISAFILYGLSLVVLPQPIGLIYEPFVIYSLALAIINILFSYGKRSIIFNSSFSIVIFNTSMIITSTYNNVLSPDIFSTICISSLISYFPVSVLETNKFRLKHKRIFQTESGEELFYKNKSRKW